MTRPLPGLSKPPSSTMPGLIGVWGGRVVSVAADGYRVTVPHLTGTGQAVEQAEAIGGPYPPGTPVWVAPIEGDRDQLMILGERAMTRPAYPETPALPAGVVVEFAGSHLAVPAGWYLCNGTGYDKNVDVDLFAAIGTTYGAGNGTTTHFNVPDIRARTVMGYTAGNANFNAEGKTGGAESDAHFHTSAAHSHPMAIHSHPLGDTGWAQIAMAAANPGFLSRRVTATTYAAGLQFATPSPPTSGGGNQTLGTALDGATGANSAANTGSTTPGQTGPVSVPTLSPFITLNYMVKR